MPKETKLEYSEEELQQLKEQRIHYMKNELTALRIEKEYSELRASISKSRFEENAYQRKLIELLAPVEEVPEKEK